MTLQEIHNFIKHPSKGDIYKNHNGYEVFTVGDEALEFNTWDFIYVHDFNEVIMIVNNRGEFTIETEADIPKKLK
jgi:hypothetical protein